MSGKEAGMVSRRSIEFWSAGGQAGPKAPEAGDSGAAQAEPAGSAPEQDARTAPETIFGRIRAEEQFQRTRTR